MLAVIAVAGASPRYARNFSLDSAGGVPRLRIFVGKDTTIYALCPQGHCPQHMDAHTEILAVPLHRVICLSSVHAGFLEALDLRDRIVAVDQASFICDSALCAMGKRGAWIEVGSDAQVNWERALSLHPDELGEG